ncbi:hypothetical protein V6N13_126453 [Hibiscus sabdariffa]|uniref:Histidine-containing phosphotransfer protein n=1 Tax=Hibiscus sabdariffa TaxID=183260 RepID=A0ABR2RFG7_9ROSI
MRVSLMNNSPNFRNFKMRITQILLWKLSLFFEDSERLLNELSKALEQQIIDFKRMDAHVHQLKGSSSSIGAQRVQKLCIVFRNYCEARNVEGLNNKSRMPVARFLCNLLFQEHLI